MLFDLRGRGRKRTVQGIYLGLALLMGGGLVFFGIGGATNGGLLNAVNSGGSGSSTYDAQLKSARRKVAASPTSAAALANLVNVELNVANQYYDANTQAYTAKGKAALTPVVEDWQRYLSLKPASPDAGLAAKMVQQVFAPTNLPDFQPGGALPNANQAVQAQTIVAAAQPTPQQYLRLVELAYGAGNTRLAGLASSKAVALATPAQRAQVQTLLAQIKTTVKQASGATTGGATSTAAGGSSAAGATSTTVTVPAGRRTKK